MTNRNIPGKDCPICTGSSHLSFDSVFVPGTGYMQVKKECKTCKELGVAK